MQRKKLGFLAAVAFSVALVACGDPTATPASSGSATTAPVAGAATTAPAMAATTAPAAGGAATTAPAMAATTAPAAGGGAASGQKCGVADIPAAMTSYKPRTDLKGQKIKAVLSDTSNAIGPACDKAIAAVFTQITGIEVTVLAGESSATDRLAAYRQQLNAKSTDNDVYEIDVIWPGILAQYAADLKPSLGANSSEFFQAIVQNNTVKGKYVGVPYFTDAGLLYYRTDLLKKYNIANPPATYDELTDAAKKIQDGERASNKDFQGFVWQGKSYEGLTCNVLEWVAAYGGGSFIEQDGKVSINNPQAIAALNKAKSWVGSISPAGVTTYQEPESQGIFAAGNAAFMRNWPYAYSLQQGADSKIKDQFDVTLLPKGTGTGARNADTLGGWQLMVNTYSKSGDAAAEFVKFLTSTEIQKVNSIGRSLLPTRPAVYDDPDVIKANPYYPRLKPVFSGGAVARPSTVSADLYNDVSTAIFTTVNQVLTGQKPADTAVKDLETKLTGIIKS